MRKKDAKKIIFNSKPYDVNNPKEVIETIDDMINKHSSINQHDTNKQVYAIKGIKAYINSILGEDVIQKNITLGTAIGYLNDLRDLLISKPNDTDIEEVL